MIMVTDIIQSPLYKALQDKQKSHIERLEILQLVADAYAAGFSDAKELYLPLTDPKIQEACRG